MANPRRPRGSTPSFTPFFDWVRKATGDSSTTLVYGLVWRFTQRSKGKCYASSTNLAAMLGWSRQRVMRHMRRLLELGLVRCMNPEAYGITYEFLPVEEADWKLVHICH